MSAYLKTYQTDRKIKVDNFIPEIRKDYTENFHERIVMGEFDNKVVLITGAAGGFGKVTARSFADEGAKLALVDFDIDGLKKTAEAIGLPDDRVLTVRADVSREADIENYVNETVKKFGRIDVFFNNAGIAKIGLVKDTKEADFDQIYGVNVKGVYFGMKHVIPVMEKQGSGSIINTGSVDSYGADAGNAMYASTKYAVLGMSKCAALETGPSGVRVNVVCPGPADTALIRKFTREANPDNPQSFYDNWKKINPLGRMTAPQDVANVVMFLASEKSSYVNATRIAVDGGYKHE